MESVFDWPLTGIIDTSFNALTTLWINDNIHILNIDLMFHVCADERPEGSSRLNRAHMYVADNAASPCRYEGDATAGIR